MHLSDIGFSLIQSAGVPICWGGLPSRSEVRACPDSPMRQPTMAGILRLRMFHYNIARADIAI